MKECSSAYLVETLLILCSKIDANIVARATVMTRNNAVVWLKATFRR